MLTDHVERYIDFRRVTGFKLKDPERMLVGFAQYAFERGEDRIRAETAVSWAARAGSQLQRHRCLRVVGRFAEFLHAEDPIHEIPPKDLFHTRQLRSAPHIFSQEDIASIISCAAKLQPVESLRPLTYSTMFGLIAVSGLRRQEAIELRVSDFTDDGLVIRETKFRKSRLVPLHETTTAQIERYLRARRRVVGETDHLFISLRRRKLGRHTVSMTFRKVCECAGICRTLSGKPPRLHDLRHTFAVRALERCRARRDQVNRHMLALTTYMGHACVESTYWYLENTPHLLRDIAETSENFAAGGGA